MTERAEPIRISKFLFGHQRVLQDVATTTVREARVDFDRSRDSIRRPAAMGWTALLAPKVLLGLRRNWN